MTYGEEKKTLERAFRKMLFYKLYNVTRPENNSRENEWSSRKILRCFPVLAISFYDCLHRPPFNTELLTAYLY